MIWPPPRPTLFPYTTLFRSGGFEAWKTRPYPAPGFTDDSPVPRQARIGDKCLSLDGDDYIFSHRARKVDRKSTRLNSSHITISYAVFCLKKKKGHSRR